MISSELSFIRDNFSEDFIERATFGRLLKFIQTDQQGIGDSVIGKIEKTAENALELTVESERTGEWWLLSLEFEAQPPYRIKMAGVTDTVPPSTM